MNTINPNIHPKGGHFFVERDGAKIVANSWTGVIARVTKYRKRAGYAAGDPGREVIDQACLRNPGLCVDDNGTRQVQVKRASLRLRVLKWLAALQNEQFDFVAEQEAQRRAGVCAGCANNVDFSSGCGTCKLAVRESRKELLERRQTDARLNGCAVLGEDVAVSTWLESQAVENAELPGHCWRKRA